jgi:predicted amidophosphoribosyltransferase
MDPLLIYVLVLSAAVTLLLVARASTQVPSRICPLCEDSVPLSDRTCRTCSYRFQT